MSRTYFAFSLPNQPGELTRFLDQLKAANISLLGMWGYAAGEERPRLSIVPDDAEAFQRFADSSGLDLEMGETFYFAGADKAGALVRTLGQVSDAGINIDAVEAVSGGDSFGCFIWADQSQWDALTRVLGD